MNSIFLLLHLDFFSHVSTKNLSFVSLAAHKAFIVPPEKPEILKPQDGLLDFNWMLHIPISSMSNVPLDATVMAIARLHVMGEHVTEFTRITQKYLHLVEEASKPPPLNKEKVAFTEEDVRPYLSPLLSNISFSNSVKQYLRILYLG